MAVKSKEDDALPEDIKLKGILSTKENRDYAFIADIALVLKEIGYKWFVPQAFDDAMRREKGKVTYLHVHVDKEDYANYFELYPTDLPVLDEKCYDALEFYEVIFFEEQKVWDFAQDENGDYINSPRLVGLYFVKEEFWDVIKRKKIGKPIGVKKFYRLNKGKCTELLSRMPPFTKSLLGLDSLL